MTGLFCALITQVNGTWRVVKPFDYNKNKAPRDIPLPNWINRILDSHYSAYDTTNKPLSYDRIWKCNNYARDIFKGKSTQWRNVDVWIPLDGYSYPWQDTNMKILHFKCETSNGTHYCFVWEQDQKRQAMPAAPLGQHHRYSESSRKEQIQWQIHIGGRWRSHDVSDKVERAYKKFQKTWRSQRVRWHCSRTSQDVDFTFDFANMMRIGMSHSLQIRRLVNDVEYLSPWGGSNREASRSPSPRPSSSPRSGRGDAVWGCYYDDGTWSEMQGASDIIEDAYRSFRQGGGAKHRLKWWEPSSRPGGSPKLMDFTFYFDRMIRKGKYNERRIERR